MPISCLIFLGGRIVIYQSGLTDRPMVQNGNGHFEGFASTDGWTLISKLDRLFKFV